MRTPSEIIPVYISGPSDEVEGYSWVGIHCKNLPERDRVMGFVEDVYEGGTLEKKGGEGEDPLPSNVLPVNRPLWVQYLIETDEAEAFSARVNAIIGNFSD